MQTAFFILCYNNFALSKFEKLLSKLCEIYSRRDKAEVPEKACCFKARSLRIEMSILVTPENKVKEYE